MDNWVQVFMLSAVLALGSCQSPKNTELKGTAESYSAILLVFDPTIAFGEDSSLSDLLVEITASLKPELAPNTEIALFFVDDDMYFASPVYSERFEIDTSRGGEEKDEKTKNTIVQELVNFMKDEWKDRDRSQPTSCIVSALERVERYCSSKFEGENKIALWLISDMLEVCHDWNMFVNLENGMSSLDDFEKSEYELRLSCIDRVIVSGIKNEHFQGQENRELRRVWRKHFDEWGLHQGLHFNDQL